MMKGKTFRRLLSAALTLCMVLALLPTSAFAATTVTPSPNTGNSSVNELEVEYFSSTLYNWDESAANAATATADYSTSVTTGVLSTASTGTLWTITAVDGVENGYTVSTTIDGTEWYITWGGGNNADAELTTTATTILITDATYNGSSVISLAVTSGSYPYLNYYSSSQGFGGWSSGAGSDTGSQFTLYASDNTSTALTTSSITSGSQYYIKNTRASAYLTGTTSTSEGYEGKGFYFTGSGNKGDSVPSFSQWVTNAGYDQNYMIYSGLAASTLSESSNAPFNTDVVNAANLFATDGSNTSYTDVYTDVQVPFVYDSETGYYTLDSDSYGVYFANGTASSGATMAIADLPMGYYAYAGTNYYKCGFAPFNTPSSTTASGYEKATGGASNTTTVYPIAESMVYGFGMVTEVDFQMTDDGQLDSEDIIFEFSGDDDVWVYIDGVLVLDIGGTHDAIKGTINFRTGEVTLTAENYSYIGDKATGTVYDTNTMSQTNLYTVLGTTLTGFASEGTHTMTIYYMDRGQGRTNCLIKFNLPQEDSLSVTKDIADTYTDGTDIDEDTMANLSNIDFTFTLYNKTDSVVANENYSLYDADGNFVQTGSTDSAGTFTLKNGYTAVFNNVDLDEEGSWYVVENLSSSRWVTTSSYTATINNSTTTDNTGTATSGTVTLTENGTIGSDLSADSISYTFTNQYVKGADPDVDVYDETIVLDYGLPVEVDVTANDITTLYGKAIGSEYNPSYELELVASVTTGDDGEEVVTTTEKLEGTYGYATINDDGNIVYTLTEDFCGIETVQYQYSVTVTVENDEGENVEKTGSATGTLTIIPATSVYYEENFSYTGSDADFTTANVSSWNNNSHFITIATNSASFTESGSSLTGYQETGLVGTTTDSTYGTDEVYLDNLCDSYGTSLKVDTTSGAAQYKYEFTGMGTTIYGRVSSETAYIKVTVNAVDEDGEETETDTQLIDTINLVTKTDEGGEETILDETLYNIPIYQNNGLHYGTYVVRIYVYTEGTSTGARDSGGEFYLDGVRVYKPMGDSTADNEGYETAASAYATDGEANVAVVNIREKTVADGGEGYISDVFTLTDIDGEIVDIDTYNDIGPNEEFYLEEGYSLSFALVNWNSQNYKIYLGMKAPNGTEASVTVGSGEFTLGNSADCYYDISDYVEAETDDDGTVIGYVNIEGVSGLAALTNIKVTGVDPFELAYATDEDVTDGGDDGTATATLYMTSTAYAASLSEEEEEVAVFEPSSISVSCTYASKTKKATVNAVTSKDVSYVTINGEKATQKNVSGKYRFTLSYTKVAAGTTYEIICYNADGVASETYTVTAK